MLNKYMGKIITGETKIMIYGVGGFQRDFQYVFDNLHVSRYIVDDEDKDVLSGGAVVHIEDLQNDDSTDFIVICKYNKIKAKERLVRLGFIEGEDFIEADELFTFADNNWNHFIDNRKIAFWGVGAECEYLEMKSDVVADVYIDNCKTGKRNGKPIINPQSIDDWSKYYIIVTTLKYYMEIKKELNSRGLEELRDFIIYRKVLNEDNSIYHLRLLPSEMLKKVIYTPKWSAPICMKPFNYAELVRGHVFCCCTAWVKTSFGNMNMDSLEHIWHSYIAKIFRLSIINRSFVFCKSDECVHLMKYGKLNKNGNEADLGSVRFLVGFRLAPQYSSKLTFVKKRNLPYHWIVDPSR